MEYLQKPISDDCAYVYSCQETEPIDMLNTIRGGYIMIDTNDLVTFRKIYGESIKTDKKFILRSNEIGFLYEIDPKILHNMTHLIFSCNYNNDYCVDYFHELKSLKYLEINSCSEDIQKFIDKLPNSLEALILLDYHDIKIFDNLPITLKYLVINGPNILLNQSLDFLPINLEVLIIRINNFNQPIDNLPPNLKVLIIKSLDFNQTLNNLPYSLEYLVLISAYSHKGLKYTQPITNLPPELKNCVLDSSIYYDYKDIIQKNHPKCNITYDRNFALEDYIANYFGIKSL